MLHEPLRAVERQSTFLHAVQHGGVSCMGVTNPSLALSGHARQFRATGCIYMERGDSLCAEMRHASLGARPVFSDCRNRARPVAGSCQFLWAEALGKHLDSDS